MAQSVELLLDPEAEAVIRAEWVALAAAGLPSEDRSDRPARPGSEHHRPHVTLWAGDRIDAAAEAALPAAVADLDLSLQLGSLMVFGPRRGGCILVRSVVPSLALLQVQTAVAAICDADPEGQFGAGRWSPHVTLARRVRTADVGACLGVVDGRPITGRSTRCRRWDGEARAAWRI